MLRFWLGVWASPAPPAPVRTLTHPPAHLPPQVEAVEHMVEDAGQHNVSLDGLAIRLGPDLRAMYPLVMNFGVEGELTVSGPAHPDQVRGERGRGCAAAMRRMLLWLARCLLLWRMPAVAMRPGPASATPPSN